MPKNKNLSKITNYLTADTDNGILSSNVSQTITGSLTVTGNLTAQQFIVSSSVTYLTESFASGSHKFGDSSDDNHNFTGSLIVSGSANPLKVGSNLLFVSSSGFIGINNVSPTVALDVTGAGKFSTTVTSQTGFKLPANGNGTSPTLAYNNSLGFGVNGTGIFFGNLYNSDLTTAMQLRVTNAGGTDITAMTLLSSGNVGIGTTTPQRQFVVSNGGAEGLEISTGSGRSTIISYNRSTSSWLPLVLTEGSSNVLIGTTTDNGNKLHVNGSIYAGGAITSTGTITANILSVNSAVYTYNVQQSYYGQNFTFTPPNTLNSGSDNSLMRMYMVWVWGANGATEAGARVWMIAMNGGGTSHTVSQLLGRDANGATSLSLARTSASELTISSNNNAFIKYVSVMQLMTYANG